MNFNSLIPDFNALKGIDYRKPVVDKSNTVALVALCAAVLGVIFVFLPWFSVSGLSGSEAASRLGISLWYGIFGFIFAVVAVAGVLYKQNALAFWAAVLCVILGLIGWFVVPSLTHRGKTLTAEEVNLAIEIGKIFNVKVGHIGAILFTFAGLVTAACTFMLATGKKVVLNVK